MTRGRTQKGRSRAERHVPLRARPLLRGEDQGEPIFIAGKLFDTVGERWIDSFLRANDPYLRRLDLHHEVDTREGLRLALRPGQKIGAIPLLSPSTRRVVAGVLIAPRFQWAALGSVFESTGFAVEPMLGGAPLVPGSAREVPPWLIAGPVLGRLEQLLRRRKRAFVERRERRGSPRGRVDWSEWARHDLARGAWQRLPCVFTELDDDPQLFAGVRWTLARLANSLAPHVLEPVARSLLQRIESVRTAIGPGLSRRPSSDPVAQESAWILEAREAMGWVAEERGLGGARSLDGLCWDLAVDQVWEAWVGAFAADLAPRLGLVSVARGALAQPLHWHTSRRSLGMLIPDAGLRGAQRVVWVDAKYKAHLALLGQRGWHALAESVRAAHRADLHQALAYAAMADVEQVDTVLAYPELGAGEQPTAAAIASLASGRRSVRLILAGIPFGFRSPGQRERSLAAWHRILAA